MSPLIISSGSPVGLFFLDFDSTSGRLGIAKPSPIVAGATFVVSNASGTRLYATLEENSHLAAIAVDRASGSLTLLNSQPVGAAGPCHLALDHTAQTLVVASYSGGAISAFPVQPDGSLGERSALFFHEGTGPDLPRQDRAHAHSVTISPDQRVCYACDLTLDEVVVYRLGSSPGELLSPTVPPGRVPPGHGPRHAKITRDGRFLYVLNELRGSITTFAIATVDGSLTALDTIPTLPPDHHGFNNSSEIRLHPLNEAGAPIPSPILSAIPRPADSPPAPSSRPEGTIRGTSPFRPTDVGWCVPTATPTRWSRSPSMPKTAAFPPLPITRACPIRAA